MGSIRPGAAPGPRDAERIAGRYRVEARLAQGGMGTVYRVIDESSGNRIALKRLLGSANSAQNVILFAREYHTLVSLSHPRVIEVYEYGVDQLGPYYTMELLEGRDLRELAPLPYREACRHLRDVASSLALLHARRLLHRDVSARNVRVTADGRCKLIDFGALTNFGVTGQLVGTPPNIAPEALRGDPLDQRADLYSLGALAYALLSGRQAYPARRLEDLIDVWRTPPKSLALLAPEIPSGLEELVLSLLSHDPLARPVSAAEVIEHLNHIAELEPEDELAVAQGYLLSPAFVGRDSELERLKRALSRANEGHGRAVFIEAPVGMGKTRLLGELALQAQTLGVAVLQVDGEMHERSFGVLEALALKLLDVMPEQALTSIQPHATVLGHLSGAMRKRLAITGDLVMPDTPGEWRSRVQLAMQSWLLAVAATRPLLVAVDNLQVVDSGSAALLASLCKASKHHKLLVACSLRKNESVAAFDAVRILREQSVALKLGGLGSKDIHLLVRSLFGDIANAARLAEWLHAASAGSPLHCVELARHLAATQAARYENGAWILPENLSSIAPAGLSGLISARISQLSSDAVDFASALSVQRGALSLDLCVALWAVSNHERLFKTLDELLREGILVSQGEGYRFSQQALRETLLERLEPRRCQTLHRIVADLLLRDQPDDALVNIEAGWHLLRAGDETRGADLLARVGGSTRGVAAINNHFHAVVPALEAALRVYRKQKRSTYEIAPLLAALSRAGYYVDRRLAAEYGDETLEILQSLTGLSRARRLRPWLGARFGLIIGILTALLLFWLPRRGKRDYGFRELFVNLYACVTTLCGVSAICLDPEKVRKYAQVLEPLLVLGIDKTPSGIYEYCTCLMQLGMGEWGDARTRLLKLVEQFSDPAQFRSLPDEARKLYQGGVWYALGVVESFRDGPAALHCAEQLEKLGLRLYDMVAGQVRVLHYACRGELERANEYRERVDLHAVQVGSAWQVEVWSPGSMVLAYLAAEDPIGLKRATEQLERLCENIPSLSETARLARVAYLVARGEYAKVLEYAAELERATPRAHSGWAASLGALAAAHNHLGKHSRAREICSDALGHLTTADRPFAVANLRLEIELALADAGLGATELAASALEALIEEHRAGQGPLTLGLLHRARARVAIMAKDADGFIEHFEQTQRWFRPTRNPTLIAHCERLEKQAAEAGIDDLRPASATLALRSFQSISRRLTGNAPTIEELATRALELIVQEAGGSGGFIYRHDDQGLRLIAKLSANEPSSELEEQVLARIQSANAEHDGLEVESTIVIADCTEQDGDGADRQRHMALVLCTRMDDRMVVFGAAAVEGKDLFAPSYLFLDSVARGLLGVPNRSDCLLSSSQVSANVPD